MVTDEYTFRAFGETAAETGSTENPWRWIGRQGYYHDGETGRYTLRQRTYDAGTGRFLSEDPIRDDEENLYRTATRATTRSTRPIPAGCSLLTTTKISWKKCTSRPGVADMMI